MNKNTRLSEESTNFRRKISFYGIYSFTYEESHEISCSFTSQVVKRFYLITMCKRRTAFAQLRLGRQNDG
ncbi:MAG: hypothetical protein K9N09_06730 [Candidatus Cloacimonetes bacterium]|nr:hypothetical protein [Candidatus Cloacimonadota bacterium]MCF7814301.1 hypothetical protein [Candidatus Cloacimonadota bacterium]MCF7868378.1 hypothetical protein [Candidatus Cloacimonadota bacterium]